MFDFPEAKRVRRDEVRPRASSRSPSPVNESILQDAHTRLGKLLDLDGLLEASTTVNIPEDTPEQAGGEDDEQEFEFRLFSAPANFNTAQTSGEEAGESNKVSTGVQRLRIRLRSPTPGDPSDGRFVKASRGWQYYFSTPSLWSSSVELEDQTSQSEKREQIEDMAVTGEHILTWAKSQPWPGCHIPWRVIHLKRHQTKLPRKDKDVPVYVIEGEPPSKSPKTRKKPGKKRRLLLRKRAVAAQMAKDTEAEKRTRKNRERKIKRRQKAREQKAAAGTAGDTLMVDADGASSEDD
ncbi:uncharacterized protein N7484_006705 [Penicillium longicatenatum]|uniref:uncharacterized protein n=1 Tax=Penicillium longicatenatum TaxID=1561947 RepID=UPI0025488E01|nr:uncharacterized protein N7484_006705 [Penicillium longicatenatum]KAJ5644198.1 hypothetical protein N7484_006705 [Penicillium longicatenatum]